MLAEWAEWVSKKDVGWWLDSLGRLNLDCNDGTVRVTRTDGGQYAVVLTLDPWVFPVFDHEAEMLRREGTYIGPYANGGHGHPK